MIGQIEHVFGFGYTLCAIWFYPSDGRPVANGRSLSGNKRNSAGKFIAFVVVMKNSSCELSILCQHYAKLFLSALHNGRKALKSATEREDASKPRHRHFHRS
ncbi:hypothetical protein GGR96_002787 [Thalassospira tepidiphila]|uniref:Uncharacterized protein n=2 Tax=Thalassospira tepidiphila TaxID=393657 RepID=A0A853KW06_9PROT|nr:hypothetical protein [Thalassospira tepidiphila]OAZ08472.1 hypothetical protein TH4_17675 [Thalassospira tepidiphila MCCC 1A03514]